MKAQPKVLLFSADFPPDINGVGDYTAQLAGALHDAGCDVSVLTGPLQNRTEAAWPFPVLRPFAAWSQATLGKVASLCDTFDVVHIQYPGVALGRSMLPNFLPAALRKRGPKTVATFHEFRAMRTRWRARASVMLRGLDVAVLADGADAPLLRRWSRCVRPIAGPPRVEAVPIAPNIPVIDQSADARAAWRAARGIGSNDIALLFFGILYPHKGVDLLLDAAEQLNRGGLCVQPIIVGNFDREAPWRAAMEARLSMPGVTWLRDAQAEDVSRAMHASDIAVLPYDSGAGPNRSSLLTALEHGLPTVTTDGPSTPSDFRTTGGVIFVPPKDGAAVTRSLRTLVEDSSLRERLSQDAREASQVFSWPGIARRHLEIYSRLWEK